LQVNACRLNENSFLLHNSPLVGDPDSAPHQLEFDWTFWYDKRQTQNKGRAGGAQQFESNLEAVGTFSTVEEFWKFYNHVRKPDAIEANSNYHLFKKGIKPMWEDDANARGGKWVINLKSLKGDKNMLNQYWENLVLGMIGETIDVSDEITGAVVARRRNGDRIAIWTRGKDDAEVIMALGRNIQSALEADHPVAMEFQAHEDSMRTGASYTNPFRFKLP